jgi:hypothetical protein
VCVYGLYTCLLFIYGLFAYYVWLFGLFNAQVPAKSHVVRSADCSGAPSAKTEAKRRNCIVQWNKWLKAPTISILLYLPTYLRTYILTYLPTYLVYSYLHMPYL